MAARRPLRSAHEEGDAMTRTVERVWRNRGGYDHLAPLHVAWRSLPAAHPLRTRLRRELIVGYHPVAVHIASRYTYRREDAADVDQVASLGLILAVDRFEPDRGTDFLSFAVPTITGEVLRYFRDRSAPLRVPRRLRELKGPIHDAAAELGQRFGRAARPSEIAEALDIGVEVVLDGLAAEGASHAFSLDEPVRDNDGYGRDRGRVGPALVQIEHRFDLVEHRELLGPLLDALPERERMILRLRFFDGMTQTEIGQRVGLSQMHVSRLLARTLRMLRQQLTTD
jgi:RNA polymerase sigma-B factor